jgi:hypothetical protein
MEKDDTEGFSIYEIYWRKNGRKTVHKGSTQPSGTGQPLVALPGRVGPLVGPSAGPDTFWNLRDAK